jgi:hypothetical protein
VKEHNTQIGKIIEHIMDMALPGTQYFYSILLAKKVA